MEKTNKMANTPMTKLVLGMSLPLMVSLLVQSLYNIVDSIFVAKLSENALAATSLSFPVQMLMIALAVGTSVGINALLSRLLGQKRMEDVGYAATTGFVLALLSSAVFVLAGLLFVHPIAWALAKGGENAGMCGTTFLPYHLATPLTIAVFVIVFSLLPDVSKHVGGKPGGCPPTCFETPYDSEAAEAFAAAT